MASKSQFKTFFISPFGEDYLQEELNSFLKSNIIINIEKQFISTNNKTGWLILVEFLLGDNQKQFLYGGSSSSKLDPKSSLSPKQSAIYEKLRIVRKEIAEKQGVQVFTVCNNAQLAEISVKLPTTINDFKKIKTIGEGRANQYGQQFIEVIKKIIEEDKAEGEKKEDSTNPETSSNSDASSELEIF